ncbi:hypothetical protein HPB47_024208 [Ixodes persulcatus]|uniref:Uncharacterized protein n=1 Tax=Ixodes persulcatus TaxID=34615 RepID=A0AC60Q633_IXOPE|nr:hypothetical protein HPB47_024208 [Ixodes persulcatus]
MGRPLRDHLAVRYLLSEARRHQVTEKRLCRAHMELQGQTATYLCYLASTRKGHVRRYSLHARSFGLPLGGLASLTTLSYSIVNFSGRNKVVNWDSC